jgi:hypothetical protein
MTLSLFRGSILSRKIPSRRPFLEFPCIFRPQLLSLSKFWRLLWFIYARANISRPIKMAKTCVNCWFGLDQCEWLSWLVLFSNFPLILN